MRDVLGLQSEVARAIANEIQVTLTPQERARLARARPVNLEAHEAYIRGRYDWGRAHLERSIEHFERAIAIDPDYALAYAGIADTQCKMFGAAMEMVPPTEVAPLARAAAVKALELDESLAEPHVSLSRVLFWHDRDPVGAERELRRAIQLNPNSAMAHFVCGLLLANLSRGNEAMAAFQRALQIDPVSCWNSTISGYFMCELGQQEASRSSCGRRSTWTRLSSCRGRCRPWSIVTKAGSREATAEANEGLRRVSGLPIARGYAGYVLATAGRRPQALAMLGALENMFPPTIRAGNREGVVLPGPRRLRARLRMAGERYRRRDSMLPHLALMRAFNQPLRPDPRFPGPAAPPWPPTVAVTLEPRLELTCTCPTQVRNLAGFFSKGSGPPEPLPDPGHTGHVPTARPSASSKPCDASGPVPSLSPHPGSAPRSCRATFALPTATEPMPHSVAGRPSAGRTTLWEGTPSA